MRPRQRSPALLTVLLAVGFVALGTLARTSGAAFSDTTENASDSFVADICFARPDSVQVGSTTSTANGTVTVPVTAVDPGLSFLIFNSRHNGNRPVNSMIRGKLNATGTAVEFTRVTNEATPVTISIVWYLVTYEAGISVQRGEVAPSSLTTNVTLTALGSTDRAFVTWSKTPASGDSTFGNDDFAVVDITSTTNLQVRVNATNASHTIAWQVVEFLDADCAAVQRGTTSLPSSQLSTTVTLGSSVDTSRSFLLLDYRSSDGTAAIGNRMLRGRITGPTSVVIDRSVGTAVIDEISWQVIELGEGSRVQSGSASLGVGISGVQRALSTVDTTRAYAFGSTQAGSGQNAGRTDYVGDDITGAASFTLLLSPTGVTLNRNHWSGAADLAYFVVDF